MVIVQLKGGLGNQLFQYAAALALANRHNTDLKVFVDELRAPDEVLGTNRRYVLDKLLEPPAICTPEEYNKYDRSLLDKLGPLLPTRYKSVFKDVGNGFSANIWRTKSSVLLKGNFQSYQYFTSIEQKLFQTFQFSLSSQNAEIAELLQQITSSDSLAIHIRRGDYVTNKIASDWLGVLPLSYYHEAINSIQNKQTLNHVFVFSDDIAWAQTNLQLPYRTTYVDVAVPLKDVVEFELMKHCKHHIIANSSFSWWAAFLNSNPNKKIIAPKRWYNKVSIDTSTMHPLTWQLL
jgi:hypothetical protein